MLDTGKKFICEIYCVDEGLVDALAQHFLVHKMRGGLGDFHQQACDETGAIFPLWISSYIACRIAAECRGRAFVVIFRFLFFGFLTHRTEQKIVEELTKNFRLCGRFFFADGVSFLFLSFSSLNKN